MESQIIRSLDNADWHRIQYKASGSFSQKIPAKKEKINHYWTKYRDIYIEGMKNELIND